MVDLIPPSRLIIRCGMRWRDAQLARGGDAPIPSLLDTVIVLTIAYRNGTPLDFEALLAGPLEDLEHDVGGCVQHVDRHTGRIEGLFRPLRVLQPAPSARTI